MNRSSKNPYAWAGPGHLIPAFIGLWLAFISVNATGDARQVYSGDSPGWLGAIGKLQVPGNKYDNGRRSHYSEDCSATLVARAASTRADTIITAWHCLEFYNDLSKPITFTLLPGSEATITREAYRLADGGGMHSDWAILRLYKAISSQQLPALRIHADHADPGRPIIMAKASSTDSVTRNMPRIGNKTQHPGPN